MMIQKASLEQANALTELTFRSKAHWGYSDSFMEACREDLTITPAYLSSACVYVAMDGDVAVGYYALETDEQDEHAATLGYLFVDPQAIGKGHGRALWSHMRTIADQLGIRTVTIHSDPFAEPFYLAMGAVRIGETPSTAIPGRMLPFMQFVL
ncbi:GNAT family N-acetyltransferase [Brevibacillus fluminis]|uniref:GNAT family N-acetyltransferase n=1 Tax=Brevibacillus fluminis TaxID=511487 RepID=A0A3M8DW35_9BACL|nr:GNAT family N-acetyltransferase [Brevibacillus fluminis]RNB92318.1 GNAT family N-acetyltransferase [Brevibacillus fluminis]